MLNMPLVPWAMREYPYLAPSRVAPLLGHDAGPVVWSIPLVVAGMERITGLAHTHAHGWLHAICADPPWL